MNRVSAASRPGSPATVNLPSMARRARGCFDLDRKGHQRGGVGEQSGRGQETDEQKTHCIQFTIKVEWGWRGKRRVRATGTGRVLRAGGVCSYAERPSWRVARHGKEADEIAYPCDTTGAG